MATYKEIFGKQVKFLSTDPANEAEGQIWYNSTSDTFKSVVASEAWSAGGPLADSREGLSGFGLQTAAIAAGGETTVAVGNTEEYNGSGWETKTAMNTANRALAAAGVVTAGVVFGGFATATNAELWDGSSWTATGALNTGRNSLSGAGIQNSALAMGGQPGIMGNVEAFNGSTWTAKTALNTARVATAAAGSTNTAVLVWGGYTVSPPTTITTETESWNGTSWTTSPATLNTATYSGGGAGVQTSAITFGGTVATPAKTNLTQRYDGTSWTTSPATLATARGLAAAGTSSVALGFGGPAPGGSTLTEEFNIASSIITPGAWSSKPAMSLARYGGASGGSPTAAFYATGYSGSYTNTTEEFNGTSWGAGGVITDTSTQSTGGAGTLTAGLKMGGSTATAFTFTEEYNGASWTGVPGNLNTATTGQGTSGSGIQSAAIYTRGRPTTDNETYNGTVWTTKTTISGSARSGTNSGTSTAALYMGGEVPPGPYVGEVEEFNGTGWTTQGSLVVPQGGSSNSGPSTDTIAASGYTLTAPWGPGNTTYSQTYDGTAWATAPSVGTARSSGGSSNRGTGGGSNGALMFAGNTTTVEEFTAETSALNYRTITTS